MNRENASFEEIHLSMFLFQQNELFDYLFQGERLKDLCVHKEMEQIPELEYAYNIRENATPKTEEWWLPIQHEISDSVLFSVICPKNKPQNGFLAEFEENVKPNQFRLEPEVTFLKESFGQKQSLSEEYGSKKTDSLQKMRCTRDISRSETKNISKNYGKALLKFIRENPQLINKMLLSIRSTATYQELNGYLQTHKKVLNKISDIKGLWINHPFDKEVRVITDYFIRRYSYHWIFNSRIQDTQNHLKYRSRFGEAVKQPYSFCHLKF